MPRFGRPTKSEKLVAQIVEELSKSGMSGSPLGSSGYATATPAEPYANSGGQGIVQVAGEIVPLQRPGGGADGFGAILGPAAPLIPALIDEPLDATGRPLPRRYEYQVAQNLNLTQTEVPFAILRRLTEQCDVIHRCIEIRISDIQKQDWSFGPSAKALTAIMEEQNCSHSRAAQIFREQYGDQMVRLQEFWENPYVHTDRGWNEWIAEFLWQHFAFDGVPVYPRYSLGGDLLGFDIIDSPTIKVLLDNRGDVPYPPQPAYQQVLWGFPRGEFVATPSTETDGEFVDAMKGRIGRTDALAYFVRNRRTWSPYGYSHVEECIPAATLYLERQSWMRNEYQSGATPMTWMRTNSHELDIRKLQEFERILNDKLTGSTVERHRVKVLPDGFEPVAMPSIDERYKPEYDEYIIKQIASKFGVSPTQLGVIPRQGLGGKGQQDGESDQAETVSGRPTANFIIEVVNSLSRRFLGMDKAITFQLSDNESAKDEEAKFKGYQISLYSGAMTLNDVRGELGLPLYDMPEADEPMIVAGNQVQFIKGLLETDSTGEVVSQSGDVAGHPVREEDEKPEASQGVSQEGAQDGKPEGEEPVKREESTDETGLELKAFHKYALARIKKGGEYRDFQFRTISEDDAYALNQDVQAIIKGETYTPPQGVRDAAKRALAWIADGKAGSGFTDVGRKRAADLARGAGVSITTVRRMKAYFDRHAVDKKATGFSSGEEGYPSPGRVAWDAWGGDAGYSWVKGIIGSEEKAAESGDNPKVLRSSTTKRSKDDLPHRKSKEKVEKKHAPLIQAALAQSVSGVDKALSQAMKTAQDVTDVTTIRSMARSAVDGAVQFKGEAIKTSLSALWIDAGNAGARGGATEILRQVVAPRSTTELLARSNIVIKGLSDTTMNRVSDIIGQGIAQGQSAREIGTLLNAEVNNPYRADLIAITETNRAYNAAALDQYQAAGFAGWEWVVYEGACELCLSQAGYHDMADTDHPPLHPNCQCDVLGSDEVGALPSLNIEEINPPDVEDALSAEALDPLYSDALSEYKYVGPMSLEDAAAGTNPLYSTGTAYKENCARCVNANELRRRGYDVQATKYVNDRSQTPMTYIGATWRNEQNQTALMGISKEYRATAKVRETMESDILAQVPEGGRGFLQMMWKGRSRYGHVISWEVKDGKVTWIDPQNNEVWTATNSAWRRMSKPKWVRIDHLKPTGYVKQFVKGN